MNPLSKPRADLLAIAGSLLGLLVFAISASAATHPLEPLSVNELRAAVEILRKENKVATNTYFPMVTLQEPSKEKVLGWRPEAAAVIPREAFVTAYDLPTHQVHEAVVNLDEGKVAQWHRVPGVEPLQTTAEYAAGNQVLQTNELWVAALKRRGITNLALVDHGAIPAGVIPVRGGPNGARLYRAVPFLRTADRLTWYPIEGLMAIVDMSHRKVLEVIDRDVYPLSKSSMDIFDPAVRGRRDGLKPLVVSQPEGVNFTIKDHAVTWDRWHFRYSIHPREGLVLHQIAWEEPSGKLRPILYRASVSDLLVPYSDTDEMWSWRAYFDEGDFGFGYYALPVRRGIETVSYARLLSEPLPDGTGGARQVEDLVDIYERDGGILWSHQDAESHLSAGPRARELVIGYLTTVGNYDYRFQWSFRQDGSIEFHVYLTGILQLKGTHATTCAACAALASKAGSTTLKGEQGHGVLIADHLLAPHHQHFFNLRLDFDVDGTANSIKEFNLATDSHSHSNPFGNGFSLTETVFSREREAVRDLNPASHRMWAVFNAGSVSSLGHPAAYVIEPGMNTVPFLAKDSPALQRAGFTDHHFFATRYRPTELHAAGDYPVAPGPPNNLSTWTHNNESILNEDVVVWYTFGVTHVARPEDFPVMPTAHANVRFLPMGFFERNPALEVPDTPAKAAR